jgi:Bacterial Ig-like domain (group 2)
MMRSFSLLSRFTRVRSGALALAVLALAACDDSTGSSNEIFRLDVDPPAAVLNVGSVQQMVATPVNPDGRILERRSITWTSSTPAVATIDENGLVTAVAGGTTTISAATGGETAEVTLTVLFAAQSPPPLDSRPPSDRKDR